MNVLYKLVQLKQELFASKQLISIITRQLEQIESAHSLKMLELTDRILDILCTVGITTTLELAQYTFEELRSLYLWTEEDFSLLTKRIIKKNFRLRDPGSPFTVVKPTPLRQQYPNLGVFGAIPNAPYGDPNFGSRAPNNFGPGVHAPYGDPRLGPRVHDQIAFGKMGGAYPDETTQKFGYFSPPSTPFPKEPILSANVTRRLANSGIRDVYELSMKSEYEMTQIHQIDPIMMEEIKAYLNHRGMKFSPGPLELSQFVQNILLNANCPITSLHEYTEVELLNISGVGMLRLAEIKGYMDACNLKLKPAKVGEVDLSRLPLKVQHALYSCRLLTADALNQVSREKLAIIASKNGIEVSDILNAIVYPETEKVTTSSTITTEGSDFIQAFKKGIQEGMSEINDPLLSSRLDQTCSDKESRSWVTAVSLCGINTFGDLTKYSKQDLLKIPGITINDLQNIITTLAIVNLKLKADEIQKSETAANEIKETTATDSNEKPQMAMAQLLIADAGLLPTTERCMRLVQIKTLYELTFYSGNDLLTILEFGDKELKDIKAALKKYGLTLRSIPWQN